MARWIVTNETKLQTNVYFAGTIVKDNLDPIDELREAGASLVEEGFSALFDRFAALARSRKLRGVDGSELSLLMASNRMSGTIVAESGNTWNTIGLAGEPGTSGRLLVRTYDNPLLHIGFPKTTVATIGVSMDTDASPISPTAPMARIGVEGSSKDVVDESRWVWESDYLGVRRLPLQAKHALVTRTTDLVLSGNTDFATHDSADTKVRVDVDTLRVSLDPDMQIENNNNTPVRIRGVKIEGTGAESLFIPRRYNQSLAPALSAGELAIWRNTNGVVSLVYQDPVDGLRSWNAIKTIWFPADYDDDFGSYRVRELITVGDHRFNFRVPVFENTFTVLNLDLLFITSAGASGTGKDIDLFSEYAAVGEPSNQHTESSTTRSYNLGAANAVNAIDLKPVFTLLESGDSCGVEVDHNLIGGSLHYLGIRMRYV
jgi:hypothetical protein